MKRLDVLRCFVILGICYVCGGASMGYAQTQRPAYQYLRFEEDYSFLASPGLEKDFFDPVKFIPLSERVWMQLGGELRLRYEEETNKFLAPGPQSADGFLLTRLALHLDLHVQGVGRLFAEGIHGDVYDRDDILFFIHRNYLDLHQLFVDVELGDAILRVGRQEMAHGTQHVLSASGWGRMRKRFDAVQVIVPLHQWRAHAWYSRPVLTETESADVQDKHTDFAGIHLTGTEFGMDIYYLFQQNNTSRLNPNGNEGKRTFHTIGTRFTHAWGAVDLDLDVAAQPAGEWAGDKIRAWSAGIASGYTFLDSKRRPRLGIGIELASGDEDPLDNVVNTFDQLYRQEKDHLGYLVMYGRQNIHAFNLNAKIGIIPRKVLLEVFHYWFYLNSDSDAIYNPGALPLPGRRDLEGLSGRTLGRELDLVLGWQINRHHSILAGYLHYWNGGFIQATGNVTDPGNVFLQYKLLF